VFEEVGDAQEGNHDDQSLRRLPMLPVVLHRAVRVQLRDHDLKKINNL
jgi:hypothetical protein